MRLIKIAISTGLIVLAPLAVPVTAADRDINLDLFKEVYAQVHAHYVDPVSDKQLLEGAIKGMLGNLDPHSGYMDAKEYAEMRVQNRGEFGGLGLQVTMENGLVKVITPIDDTPAAHAGLKPGDLILGIDDTPVSDMTLSDAVDRLRGAVGTMVKLTIRRQGVDPFQVTLTRAEIHVEPVKYHMEGNDIGYIRITNFSERTSNALKTAVDALKQQAGDKLAGVVLDLRNNPGGLLDQAIEVSNAFLDEGEIVSVRGRLPTDTRHYMVDPQHTLLHGVPVVVLINGGSASASEIVAGALQDQHRAVLLGTRSFGKGSVQTLLPVKESGGAIRLTTARYFTPSGRSIQAKGIDPDVVVEPAKIEKVAQAARIREADLRGALKNPDQATQDKAKPAETSPATAPAPAPAPGTAVVPPEANVPPGTTPVPTSEAAIDANLMGTDADYQLVRAVDLLRGVSLFKKLAAK